MSATDPIDRRLRALGSSALKHTSATLDIDAELRDLTAHSTTRAVRRTSSYRALGAVAAIVLAVVGGAWLARGSSGDRVATAPPPAVTGAEYPPAVDTTPTTDRRSTPPSSRRPRASTTSLPDGPIDKLAIGDSVMLGAAPKLAARGFTVIAESSYQFGDGVSVIRGLDENVVTDAVIVIHLGSNGPIDTDSLDALLEDVRRASFVMLVNNRGDRPWIGPNNELLESRDSSTDNIWLFDWAAESEDCTGACFAKDDIHLGPDGREFYARAIDCAIRRC